jgi:hypothetical protein
MFRTLGRSGSAGILQRNVVFGIFCKRRFWAICSRNNAYCIQKYPLPKRLRGGCGSHCFLETKQIKTQHRLSCCWGFEHLTYCEKCGAKLVENAKFCSVCGAKAAKVTTEEYSVDSDNLIERVKQLLHEGNVTRIIIKDEKGATLLEIPATVGVIGVVLVPWLAALGAIAALATKCRIVVEKRE